MSLIPNNVKIIIEDDNGNIKYAQPFSEYISQPSFYVQAEIYGNSLLDILLRESYVSSNLELLQVLTGNHHADATRLIGNIAESLVVKYCNEYPEINQTLAVYARLGARTHKSLNDYLAIGTSLKHTQQNFAQHYNPNDTQRDIIWIDKRNPQQQLLCVGGKCNSSKPAGLQIKAGHDGINYVLPSISNYFYPILYFDINDDWGALYKAIKNRGWPFELINPDEISREIKNHLKGYFSIVVKLINKEITILDIIRHSQNSGDAVLSAGIALSNVHNNESIILPSRIS